MEEGPREQTWIPIWSGGWRRKKKNSVYSGRRFKWWTERNGPSWRTGLPRGAKTFEFKGKAIILERDLHAIYDKGTYPVRGMGPPASKVEQGLGTDNSLGSFLSPLFIKLLIPFSSEGWSSFPFLSMGW